MGAVSADRRRDGRARRLPPGAGCCICGESRPELLHLHHPSTRELDAPTVGVRCILHHREADCVREAAGCSARNVPDELVLRLVAALRGRAAEFALLAAAERRAADELERLWLGQQGAQS